MKTLNSKAEVTSPTFNLLHIYDTNLFEIWHFDLYRLKHSEEIHELGIEDAFAGAVSLIEWPEIILNILPEERLDIEIDFTEREELRAVTISSNSIKWKNFINIKL